MTSLAAAADALEATNDRAWLLVDQSCDPLRESSRESRFAVSNGFLGVRAARPINHVGRSVPALPRTYVAGLFDTPEPDGPLSELVPAADWLQLGITAGGLPLTHGCDDTSPHRMVLDMRRGAVLGECTFEQGPELCVRVQTLHLVSLATPAIGLQLVRMSVERGGADVTFEASFEGGLWRTKESGKRWAMAVASTLEIDGEELAPSGVAELRRSWRWTSHAGQVVSFSRVVGVSRSDTLELDPSAAAHGALGTARGVGWRRVLEEHEEGWARRWQAGCVTVDGDDAAQRALRFALYHLSGAANPRDDRVSIGARALTGEDYHGHVFWDTEIYLLPYYTLTWPDAARALLMYRFHTLDGARAKAVRLGWRGALYAWESADCGDETAPAQVLGPDRQVINVLSGTQEQHISADVAYAVWQYWEATRDEAFLLEAGAEILFETSRFWASRAVLEADGRRHIRGVIGPDEYHEGIDDNAFTNVMARWNIRRALEVAELLRERWPARWASLSGLLGLGDDELGSWRSVAETIATGFDPGTGLYAQFEGYFELEDIDLSSYDGRSVAMDVVLGRERTQHSQVVKQADVVALLALLPAEFPGDSGAANFRYYEPRCSHGSSLSRCMHALVAARLGESSMALRYFRETAAIDLDDQHAAIAGGVHIAAQGGIWMTAVFGFAGMSLRNEGLAFDPQFPDGWRTVSFGVAWRGRRVTIRIDQDGKLVEATLEDGEPMTIFVRGVGRDLRRGEVLRAGFEGPG